MPETRHVHRRRGSVGDHPARYCVTPDLPELQRRAVHSAYVRAELAVEDALFDLAKSEDPEIAAMWIHSARYRAAHCRQLISAFGRHVDSAQRRCGPLQPQPIA